MSSILEALGVGHGKAPKSLFISFTDYVMKSYKRFHKEKSSWMEQYI